MMVICPKVLFKKKWSSNTILFLFFIEKQNSLYTFRIDFLYVMCIFWLHGFLIDSGDD